MSFFIAQSGLAIFAPTTFVQVSPPIASHQFHFKILGVLALVAGDIGSAVSTGPVSPTTIIAVSHFKINNLPVATLTISTAPPLGACIFAGSNGHFKA